MLLKTVQNLQNRCLSQDPKSSQSHHSQWQHHDGHDHLRQQQKQQQQPHHSAAPATAATAAAAATATACCLLLTAYWTAYCLLVLRLRLRLLRLYACAPSKLTASSTPLGQGPWAWNTSNRLGFACSFNGSRHIGCRVHERL